MQPRDAHDDGDCAMEEAGHSSPLPLMSTTKTGIDVLVDASSPSSSNHLVNDDIIQQPLSDTLVGARKRKAIRVVKHQVSFNYLNFN